MPFVNIQIVKEVIAEGAVEKKAEIGRRVSEAIAETTGLAIEKVWVVIEEVPGAEWYVGGEAVRKPQ
jgi:4-oxalocrotonate tautomerase